MKDLTGHNFGRLTVEDTVDIDHKTKFTKIPLWQCICECGGKVVTEHYSLIYGKCQSCGCLNRELTAQRNGERRSQTRLLHRPEYERWKGMLNRCNNQNNKDYHHYGERGIEVCDRWKLSFDNFYSDMGSMPSNQYTIERVNNNGNYEPGNCKWGTRAEQSRNTRQTRYLTFNGETLTLTDWSKKTGINLQTLSGRINEKNWSVEKALTTPIRRRGNNP